jgi:hypothetical protein
MGQDWKPGSQGGFGPFHEGGGDRSTLALRLLDRKPQRLPLPGGEPVPGPDQAVPDTHELFLNTPCKFTRLVQPVGQRALIDFEGHHDGWERTAEDQQRNDVQVCLQSVRWRAMRLGERFTTFMSARSPVLSGVDLGGHQELRAER